MHWPCGDGRGCCAASCCASVHSGRADDLPTAAPAPAAPAWLQSAVLEVVLPPACNITNPNKTCKDSSFSQFVSITIWWTVSRYLTSRYSRRQQSYEFKVDTEKQYFNTVIIQYQSDGLYLFFNTEKSLARCKISTYINYYFNWLSFELKLY